jgi:F0F1-type ATP synthase assembly protein I
MLTELLPVALGVGTGAGAQGLSEVIKMGRSLVDGLIEMGKASHQRNLENKEEDRKDYAQEQDAQDRAAKRTPMWLIAAVSLTVVGVIFFLLGIGPFIEQGQAVIMEKEPWLNLFNIIKLGGGYAVEQLHGVHIPDRAWLLAEYVGGIILGGKFMGSRRS